MRRIMPLSVMMICSASASADLPDLRVDEFTIDGYTYRIVHMKYGSVCFNEISTDQHIRFTCRYTAKYVRAFSSLPPPKSDRTWLAELRWRW